MSSSPAGPINIQIQLERVTILTRSVLDIIRRLTNCFAIESIIPYPHNPNLLFQVFDMNIRSEPPGPAKAIATGISKEHRDAVLAWMRCDQSNVFLFRICDTFLKDSPIIDKFEWIKVMPRPEKVYKLSDELFDGKEYDGEIDYHSVTFITLRDGSLYIMDLSGEQYGFEGQLVLAEHYIEKCVDTRYQPVRVEVESELENVQDAWNRGDGTSFPWRVQEDGVVIFKEWVTSMAEHGMRVHELWQLSYDDFEALRKVLVEKIQVGLSGSLKGHWEESFMIADG